MAKGKGGNWAEGILAASIKALGQEGVAAGEKASVRRGRHSEGCLDEAVGAPSHHLAVGGRTPEVRALREKAGGEAGRFVAQGLSLDFPEFLFFNLQKKTAFGGKPGLVPGSPTYFPRETIRKIT